MQTSSVTSHPQSSVQRPRGLLYTWHSKQLPGLLNDEHVLAFTYVFIGPGALKAELLPGRSFARRNFYIVASRTHIYVVRCSRGSLGWRIKQVDRSYPLGTVEMRLAGSLLAGSLTVDQDVFKVPIGSRDAADFIVNLNHPQPLPGPADDLSPNQRAAGAGLVWPDWPAGQEHS